jgi:hypothetical protein
MRKWFFLTALASCLAFAAQGGKVTFQYNFKKGQVIRSHMVMSTQMSMGKMDMNMDSSMTVDDANGDGSANLTTSVDSGDIKMGGMKMAIPGKGKKYHMVVSKYGKRIEMAKKDDASVVVQEFPDHPIGVGESWDGNVQVNGGRTTMVVNAHFTLDSLKTVDGHKIAHLLVVEDGELKEHGGMKIHATGWMDWDIDQGIPTLGHMEGTQDMGKMSSTFSSDQSTTIGS